MLRYLSRDKQMTLEKEEKERLDFMAHHEMYFFAEVHLQLYQAA